MAEERFFSVDTRNLVLTVLENWRLVLAPRGEVKGVREKLRELDRLRARFAGRVW